MITIIIVITSTKAISKERVEMIAIYNIHKTGRVRRIGIDKLNKLNEYKTYVYKYNINII